MARGEIIILAAIAEKNRVIGKDGKLPWYISEDLKRFKRLTTGYAVLMGRKTFESIVERLGKPLPERRNVVLSSTKSYPNHPEVEVYTSIDESLKALQKERKVFVIGGERVFKETLEMADRLELTIVAGEYEGDAFFPEYEHLIGTRFQLIERQEFEGYDFKSYKSSL